MLCVRIQKVIKMYIIFDMDGTLLDTQKIYMPAWKWAGEIQGFSDMDKTALLMCGTNEVGSTKYLKDHFPTLDIVKFKEDAEAYVNENLTIRYKEGVKETLDFLKEKGIKLGLASGTSREKAIKRLNFVNALDYFDVIVCGNEIENGKPAPDIFLKAANLLGAKPEECIVFEDSDNGIKSGYNAGMKVIGIPDVKPFSEEIKSMLYAEFDTMDKAIELFK
jgi:HAD superfamily hydrolase (TIGR01509 family)